MLWRSSNISSCNTLTEAVNMISSLTTHPQAVLVHAGVNDIEHSKPEDIIETIRSLVISFKQNLPNSQLILSEIIPRMDGLDRDVIATNRMIHEVLQDEEQVIIVKHHSLRNQEFYNDNKHVTNTNGVQKLAGNLKFGIRKAFGIQPKNINQSYHVQPDQNTTYNSGNPQN